MAGLLSPREIVFRRLGLESQLVTHHTMVALLQEFQKPLCLSPSPLPFSAYDQNFLLKNGLPRW